MDEQEDKESLGVSFLFLCRKNKGERGRFKKSKGIKTIKRKREKERERERERERWKIFKYKQTKDLDYPNKIRQRQTILAYL